MDGKSFFLNVSKEEIEKVKETGGKSERHPKMLDGKSNENVYSILMSYTI